ncbi:Protein ENHANCED DISEASE RESISTANCE 4 [Glycine max]|nr:Protein ENHANCED DISEASE RESISTANCE 4 [Glycine max]
MSGESAPKPKPRLVLCPKCWQLLPESPDYDVYKCGGCGTTLQAKKRRNRAVNSESNTHETDAAPRNALNRESSTRETDAAPGNALNSESRMHETGAAPTNALDTKAHDKKYSNGEQLVSYQENGFKENATNSSSGECSLNGSGGSDQIEDGECNGEQLVTSQENGFGEKSTSSSSREGSLNGNDGRDQIEDGECNAEQPLISRENGLMAKASSSSSEECSLNGNDGRDQIENGECNGEQIEQLNLPDEELGNEMDSHKLSDMRRHTVSYNGCSDEVTYFEIEALAELIAESSVENAKNTNLQLQGEELSNGNVPLEGAVKHLISTFDKDGNDEKLAPGLQKSEVDIAGNDFEAEEELNNGNLLLEGAEKDLFSGLDREEVNNDNSALVGANPEVDINGSNEAGSEELNNRNLLLEVTEEELNECASDGGDPKHDQSGLVGAKSEVDNTRNASIPQRLSTEEGRISRAYPRELEEGTSGYHASSKAVHHSFDCVRSVDTFDNTEVINPGFETSGTLGGLSKSSTIQSYHAYDGSISSNDGVDEQFPNQYLDSFENTYTVANGVSEGGSRKGKGLVNSMLRGDLETQRQSYFREGRPRIPRDNRRNLNEVSETTRHGHAHWMRTKKDEFPLRVPHHRSGSLSGYESGSTSNQMHDELYCSSSYRSPDSFDDPDQEKMKLLRMVYKLQEQLNRTSYLNGETNGRLSMGSHVSSYQSHDLHERRLYHSSDYPRCDGICSHGTNRCQKHNFSHVVPYLTEPTSSIHHVDHSFFPCCPPQWQCSAELPPRDLYQHEELCRPNQGHSCCSPCHSYPSSPQWLMTSNLPAHAHETNSYDQRHRPEVKKYFWEKPSLTRRHYRPVAGGAPFVTCHKCLKLLQLPADFLLFKRVYHQLKCGACQEVLKFSLQNRSHIVSYAPNALEPPSSSSNLDDRNEVIDGSNPHSVSHADHISYSDDYGHSVGKSYSSEGDPVSAAPLHPLHDSAYDKQTVSSGTLEPITEKDKNASRSPTTSKAPVETDEQAVNSSNNVSSELEAHSQPKSSPLHRLMGYTSPSQVIRGIP